MPPKGRRIPSEEEVVKRWQCLDLDRRQAVMCFTDPELVDRVRVGLQELYANQELMCQMGIKLGHSEDPFASSTLFKAAFEMTWQSKIGRLRSDPQVVMVNPLCTPVLVMKPPFLQRETFFDDLRKALPDFLRPRRATAACASSCPRAPFPKARWKELFLAEPASIAAMEQQLVRLVEQALWAVATDLTFQAPVEQDLADSLCADSVPFEPWMAGGGDDGKKKAPDVARKKAKRPKQKRASAAVAPLAPTVEEEASAEDLCAEDSEGESRTTRQEVDEHEPSAASPVRRAEDRGPSELDELSADEDGGGAEGPAGRSGGPRHGSFEGEYEDSDSGDESVGMGTFHINGGNDAASASDLSLEPTAASTPAADLARCAAARASRKGNQQATSSPYCSSPTAALRRSGSAMHPPQLVCYIWNQTSQLEDSPAGVSNSRALPAATPASPGFAARGGWMGTPLGAAGPHSLATPRISAVVKNTFVDIDDPVERPVDIRQRPRSLSPSHLGYREDWHDHWHL